MREHLRQHGVGYLVAVGATATVGLVLFLLSGLLGDAPPFLPFVLAVLLSAWHGGLKPGLLATALGAGVAVFLFTGPHYSFRITHDGELVGLLVFLAIGFTTSWLCGALHAARRRSEADRERLGKQITERRRAEEALRESEAKIAADLEAMTRLYDLGTRLLGCDHLQAALDEVLEGAIVTSGADYGNVQLYNPQIGALEIVAQRGFRQDFLDYFRTVRVDEGSACAQAMRSGQRIILEDVELDPAYEPHRRISAAAGYRAVQSTPLKSRNGSVLGMLSTHFRLPQRVSERNQRLLY